MSSNSTISCGPFDLLETIGQGGMAQVWRGVHRSQQTPVAVKVITGSKATDQDYVERFEREVQAVAALSHPGIVTVFDYGRISELAASSSHLISGSKLIAGSPYLAMEFARGGTLRERAIINDWLSLRTFILEMLDALAYAHARDVIHRDIKPENILCQIEGSRLRFKLSDFGIAHAIEAAPNTDTQSYDGAAAGTPRYMPPEQITGDWRDFGPWTDLYALGCLAYEIVCGHPPYDDVNFIRLANMHLNMPFPELEPRFEVPEGLDGFIRRLVVKEPRHRFLRAADAAFALGQMSGGDARFPVASALEGASLGSSSETPVSDLAPTQLDPSQLEETPFEETPFEETPFEETQLDNLAEMQTQTYAAHHYSTQAAALTLDLLTHTAQDAELLGTRGDSLDGAFDTIDLAPVNFSPPPPLPATWRSATDAGTSDQLVGAGLGLFGLRAIPMVDRDAQRDLLWNALREVSADQSLRAISLRGGTGTGKSRLVEWMTRRAHELGQATVFKALHSRQGGPAEGVPRMLENYFEAWSLERAAVYERVLARLKHLIGAGSKDVGEVGGWRIDDQARGLTELIRPTSDEGGDAAAEGPRFHFASAGERHALVASLLALVGQERPVILWADDIPWGEDTLGLLEHVLGSHETPPLLVLMTSRDDMFEERVETAERLRDIESDRRVDTVEVDALAPSDHAELIRRTLRLDSSLSEQVQQRTAGNPLFAVQLIGDWVSRGILEVGQEGFSVRQGAMSTMPRDLHDLWIQRVERLLEEFEPERRWNMRISMEIGAILGQHIDEEEWREACRQCGVEASSDLVRTMIEQGLARRERSGASFVHSLLPDGLREAAERAGRAESHHMACLRAIEALHADDPMKTARRRAHHLVGAERYEQALEPLKQAIHYLSDRGDHNLALHLLQKREEIADLLDLPAESRRRVENLWMRAQTQIPLGNTDVSFECAERAAEIAARHGWQVDEGHALVVKARVLRDRTKYQEALDVLDIARRKLEAVDDTIGLLFAIFSQGFVHIRLGKLGVARAYLSEALEKARMLGDSPRIAEVLSHIGYAYFAEDDYDRARTALAEALECAQKHGSMVSIASCSRHLGEVARFEQRWADAREYYERSRHISRTRGARTELLDLLNLAMVDIGDARYEQAQHALHQLREAFVERGLDFALPILEMARVAAAAGVGDQSEFDEALARAEEVIGDQASADKDIIWLAETAAELCEACGWADRAARVRN